MKKLYYKLNSAVLAGICIGLGGFVNLKVGGIAGAVLFAFGLLAVVHYGFNLYTGRCGFFNPKSWKEWVTLFAVTLVGNVFGCWLMSLVADGAVVSGASAIVNVRLSDGFLDNFLMAIPCGFIMTVAVEHGRQGRFLPLLFGVPLFILCGFKHSIADAFYYLSSDAVVSDVLPAWLATVVGNFVGCNIIRWVLPFK